MIRFSMIYFLVGMIIGAALLMLKAYPMYPALWVALPIHIEVMIFGWIIQFTLGTGYWILPRFIVGNPRGSRILAYSMIGCLNLGIALIIVDTFLHSDIFLGFLGRTLEAVSVILFISLHWDRIATHRN